MSVELNKYQMNAIDNLSNGKILLGGVGSGKSRTAIAYYYLKECNGKLRINGKGYFKEREKKVPLYIITTARKRDKLEWEKEMAPFMMEPSEDIKVDSWNNIKKYINVTNSFFIFDEDRVTGYGAWTKSFIKISRKNHWILCTATPGDDFMQYMPVLIANGFYKNKRDFTSQHCVYNQWTKYPKIDRYINTKKLIRERDSLLIRLDSDRIIKKHYDDIIVDYDKANYKLIFKDRWNVFDEKPIENVSQLCYLLRRVANSDISRVENIYALYKIHHKLIVFYNYDYELELLSDMCKEHHITFSQWNGHRHQDIPKTKEWIYLCNYGSCAEGWNCIETNAMAFYSQSYSYKTMIQAAGRIDRMNTPFTDLYYYILKSRAPIDLAISRCLKRKKDFNETKFIG